MARAKALGAPRTARAPRPPGAGTPCCAPLAPGRLFLASETDRLRACLMHVPGRELERLTPADYRFHLFDDLLHLPRAREEHAGLIALLRRFGVRVDTFVDLLTEVYASMSSYDQRAFLERMHQMNPAAPLHVLRQLAEEPEPRNVAEALVEGVEARGSFAAAIDDTPYFFQPLANLVFMQDAAVVLLDRVVPGFMSKLVRLPEEVVVETVIRLSHVFGPRGSGEWWLDPAFRERHHMRRTVESYLEVHVAKASLRIGAHGSGGPLRLEGERVELELDSAYIASGRHFVLEGGNLLSLRRDDGRVVVFVGHNARTSPEAVDELAYRLLREPRGKAPAGEIACVVVVDFQDGGDEALHLDARLLLLSSNEIAMDRALVESPKGPGARFYVMERDDSPREEGRFSPRPKVALRSASSFEDALERAGIAANVRWVPPKAPWEGEGGASAERWVALEQKLAASAMNALVLAPNVLVGLERHRDFYEGELGARCLDVATELDSGAFSGLSCCALLAAVRAHGGGAPVCLLLRGDELARARGGPRSLVMPLVREPEA
jgi:arginine deiminase